MTGTAKNWIKLIAVAAISAFIGILLGQLVSSYEIRFMLSREYIGETRGIGIYRVGDVNEENMALHMDMLERAPEKLTQCCEKIYFTGSDLELPMQESGYNDILGLTQGSTVYISTGSFSAYVVFHELFHTFDNANGEISGSSDEFRRIYDENKHVIPVFASHQSLYISEFFAQAGAYYILVPRELEIAAPEVYKFYNDIFGSDA